MIDAVCNVGADLEGAGAGLVSDRIAEGEGVPQYVSGISSGAVGSAGSGAALLGFFGAIG